MERKNLMKRVVVCGLVVAMTVAAWAQNGQVEHERLPFAKGADISWITQIEDNGKYELVDDEGKGIDGFEMLRQCGMNMVRLRVWVKPRPDRRSGRIWCDTKDLVAKAVRAKAAGMRVMVDFHYSNWWADPSKQHVPEEWKNCDIDALCDSVEAHTAEVLQCLLSAGVEPTWIQVGNETPTGFMKPLGDAVEHPENFARLFRRGHETCKRICPKALTMVHIDNGFMLDRTEFILDILQRYGVDYDLLGWSLYPAMNWLATPPVIDLNWRQKADQCIANVNSVFQKYGKESMIVEIGIPQDHEQLCSEVIEYMIEKAPEHLLGLVYWEPITTPDFGYTMGALKHYGGNKYAANAGMKAFRTPSR